MEKPKCKDKDCKNFGRYCRKHFTPVIKKEVKIKEVSEKRREINKEFEKIRKAFLQKHPQCMAKLTGCQGKANQVHHMKGKASKEELIDPKYFLAVCFNCHRVIEENPAFARANNLSVSRHHKKTA